MTTHTATYTDSKIGGRNPFARFAGAVAEFFGDVSRASQAAATYQRLSHLSDASLAKRGLKREDLPRHVFETVFAK